MVSIMNGIYKHFKERGHTGTSGQTHIHHTSKYSAHAVHSKPQVQTESRCGGYRLRQYCCFWRRTTESGVKIAAIKDLKGEDGSSQIHWFKMNIKWDPWQWQEESGRKTWWQGAEWKALRQAGRQTNHGEQTGWCIHIIDLAFCKDVIFPSWFFKFMFENVTHTEVFLTANYKAFTHSRQLTCRGLIDLLGLLKKKQCEDKLVTYRYRERSVGLLRNDFEILLFYICSYSVKHVGGQHQTATRITTVTIWKSTHVDIWFLK